MPVLARLEPRQWINNHRYAARRTLRLESTLADSGAEVTIHDLSVTGLLIETPGDLVKGENLLVNMPEIGPTPATVVWNRDRLFGCEFEAAIPSGAISAALLRNPITELDNSLRNIPAGEQPDQGATDEVVADNRASSQEKILALLCFSIGSWALTGSLAVWLF